MFICLFKIVDNIVEVELNDIFVILLRILYF